ncbi:MAG TPA: glycosyltransferase family 39 protein, partial [Thermoanaerobaculaceae bacterium]|nr:glycosyltransferase family 39 protein [Thermoanaerobaculaceae bacterium]
MSVLTALVVRLPFVLVADFPLGDGGLFAQVIDDLRAAGFALPAFTTFNGGSIPLCYPPLALFLAALSGLPTLQVLLWAPFVLSSLVPGAVSVLGRQILGSEHAGLATGLVAALLPIPYWFGLEGGGLTRSLGLLLMVLAVLALLRMLDMPSIRLALSTGVLLGASALTHPEGALVTAAIAIAAAAFSGKLIATRRACAVAAVAAVATILPWLVVVVSRHGFTPFLSALRAGDGFGSLELAGDRLLSWQLAGEPHLTLFAALALLGMPVAIARGWALPLVWTLLPILLVPRNCRFWAAPGLALLCGAAIMAVWSTLRPLARSPGHATVAHAVLASCVLAHGIVLSHAWDGRLSLLQPLRREDREACSWLGAHVRPGEAAAVTGVDPDGLDTLAEWAPYLAGVENILVGQGREWLGDMQQVEQHAGHLHDALRTGGGAVSRWL